MAELRPLPGPWAQVLVGFARNHRAERPGPSLPLRSNLLRIADGDDGGGIALRDAPGWLACRGGPCGRCSGPVSPGVWWWSTAARGLARPRST
jgi:hypothetical protein